MTIWKAARHPFYTYTVVYRNHERRNQLSDQNENAFKCNSFNRRNNYMHEIPTNAALAFNERSSMTNADELAAGDALQRIIFCARWANPKGATPSPSRVVLCTCRRRQIQRVRLNCLSEASTHHYLKRLCGHDNPCEICMDLLPFVHFD